jgi:hypothetical protein
MPHYRLAGQDFHFACPVPELESFELTNPGLASLRIEVPRTFPPPIALSCQTVGWVGGEHRRVETWSAPPGILLKVAGGSDFYISPGGQSIVRVEEPKARAEQSKNAPPFVLSQLDREILVGPALVLALAMRGTWCLHASAIMRQDRAMLFLGESGQGKSTLAAYLATPENLNSRLVADDILPVTNSAAGLDVWPHFPQLKLPMDSQPGPLLPETVPAGWICVLADAENASNPDLKLLSPFQATQTLLRHTAGTRLLDPELLAKHLAFCAQAAKRIPFYELSYPHRKEALPEIKEILKTLY